MKSMYRGLLCVSGLLVMVLPVHAQGGALAREFPKWDPRKPKITNDFDELILQRLEKPNDNASLIAYLKEISPSDDDLLNIPGLIGQLGSPQQAQRNEASQRLVALGLPALWPVRRAVDHKDSEIAERAAAALNKIQQAGRLNRILPAIRLLRKRKAPGAFEAILRYLPYTIEESSEEECYYSLDELAFRDGKPQPALVLALRDKVPARRALAACILGRIGSPEQKAEVRKLLTDANAVVRLRTAQGLLGGKDTSGVPTLIELYKEQSPKIVWQAEELLHWVAGDGAPKVVSGTCTEPERGACRDAWRKWWQDAVARVSMDEVFDRGRKPMLVISYGQNQAVLIGGNNRKRWSRNGGPAGLLADEGVALSIEGPTKSTIVAQSLDGKELWRKNRRGEDAIQPQPFRAGRAETVLALGPNCCVEIDAGGHAARLSERPTNYQEILRSMTPNGEFGAVIDFGNSERFVTLHANYSEEPLSECSLPQTLEDHTLEGTSFHPAFGLVCSAVRTNEEKVTLTMEMPIGRGFITSGWMSRKLVQRIKNRFLVLMNPANGNELQRAPSPLDNSFTLLRDGTILGMDAPNRTATVPELLGRPWCYRDANRLISWNMGTGTASQEIAFDSSRKDFQLIAPLIRFGFGSVARRNIDDPKTRLAEMRSPNRAIEQRRCDLMVLGKNAQDPEVQRESLKWINDDDEEVRISAMIIVDAIAKPSREIVSKLIKLLEDKATKVRYRASLALVRCEDHSWEELLNIALDEKLPKRQRLAAAEVIGWYQDTNNERIVEALRLLLAKEDNEIKKAILYGMSMHIPFSKQDSKGFAPLLIDEICRTLEESRDSDVLDAARAVVWSLKKDGAKAIPSLKKITDIKARCAAWETIGYVGRGDPKVIQLLADAFENKGLAQDVRCGALSGLYWSGTDARIAMPAVLRSLEQLADKPPLIDQEKIRAHAEEVHWHESFCTRHLHALEGMGLNAKDRDALRVLKRLLAENTFGFGLSQLEVRKLIEMIAPAAKRERLKPNGK